MSPRTFVAIGVPRPIRDDLAVATATLRGADTGLPGAGAALRATAPPGWHLTLTYLGALEGEQASLAASVTAQVLAMRAPRPAPCLGLGAADRFGDRVLFVHVHEDPPGALTELVVDLRAALEAAGFVLPAGRFRPHVTLARSRRPRPVTRADVAGLVVPAGSWRPGAIGLWAAAGPAAPRPYEVLAEFAWPAGSASAGEAGGC